MLFTLFAGAEKMLLPPTTTTTSGPDKCHVAVLHERLKTLGAKI